MSNNGVGDRVGRGDSAVSAYLSVCPQTLTQIVASNTDKFL